MKLVIQRVTRASVQVDQKLASKIGRGLLVLLGIEQGDGMDQVKVLAPKLLKLRLWPDLKDPTKQWASSVMDNDFELLVVSQFTLFATFKKPKPDFHQAMGGVEAEQLYEAFNATLRESGAKVETGIFGAMMQVELCNDGPVTVELVSNPDGATPKTSASTPKSSATKSSVTPKASAPPATNLQDVQEEELLLRQPYLGGFLPSALDAQRFEELCAQSPGGTCIRRSGLAANRARWFEHVASFSALERSLW
ncbi:unnamed protein product [Effrenium voratum]|nr:unnamed protein product [Effrenium voratum]